jgi:hypothetical protein
MRVGWPFRLPVPEYPTLLRFHSPLIEPDMRICRIRLSDKVSCVRVRDKDADRLYSYPRLMPGNVAGACLRDSA